MEFSLDELAEIEASLQKKVFDIPYLEDKESREIVLQEQDIHGNETEYTVHFNIGISQVFGIHR
jgi:hypothetical protein